MSFFISHRYGGDEADPDLDALGPLLNELKTDRDDCEHPEISVVHDNDWSLSVFLSGDVVLEHLEDGDLEPRLLKAPGRAKTLELMRKQAQGLVDELLSETWLEGYGS